jgi:hypothetical protein
VSGLHLAGSSLAPRWLHKYPDLFNRVVHCIAIQLSWSTWCGRRHACDKKRHQNLHDSLCVRLRIRRTQTRCSTPDLPHENAVVEFIELCITYMWQDSGLRYAVLTEKPAVQYPRLRHMRGSKREVELKNIDDVG